MSSFRESNKELIEKAEHCEWSLECDGKILELMQNVANVSRFIWFNFLISDDDFLRKSKDAARTLKTT
jgi:hypothetical protein